MVYNTGMNAFLARAHANIITYVLNNSAEGPRGIETDDGFREIRVSKNVTKILDSICGQKIEGKGEERNGRQCFFNRV